MIDRERREWLKNSFGEQTVTDVIEAEEKGAKITFADERDSDWIRIDEDPEAETGDTRVRVNKYQKGHNTYELVRQEYGLCKMPGPSDEIGYEKYDWNQVESFVLRSDSEAKQVAGMLEKADAFDPNVLFFRQRDIEGGD